MIEPLAKLHCGPMSKSRQRWVIQRDCPVLIDFVQAKPLRRRDSAIKMTVR
jgi:hypothetical protein